MFSAQFTRFLLSLAFELFSLEPCIYAFCLVTTACSQNQSFVFCSLLRFTDSKLGLKQMPPHKEQEQEHEQSP